MATAYELIDGDLLTQLVEVIVNPWNTNRVPWWLLLPHGVSGAIKRRAGTAPFRELQALGPLALGQAVLTQAGNLNYKAIIHVASITLWGRSRPDIVRAALTNALALAQRHSFASLACPLLGSGSGGLDEDTALATMLDALTHTSYNGKLLLVRYTNSAHTSSR